MKPNSPQRLRAFALSLPETEEGVACEGTALEKRTIKVRKKAFVFIGKSDLMFKLRESLAKASAIANEQPDLVKVGATGWVTVKFEGSAPVSLRILESWIEESYRLFSGESSTPKDKTKSTKRKAT